MGVSLGFSKQSEIERSLDIGSSTFDIDAIVAQVEERLPAFKRGPKSRPTPKPIKFLYTLEMNLGGGLKYRVSEIGLPTVQEVYSAKIANRAAAGLRHLGFDIQILPWKGN